MHFCVKYARWMDAPIINMADDKYHPCQGLSDVMGMQEHRGDLTGKTVLMTWRMARLHALIALFMRIS